MSKQTICIDFDATICSYDGWGDGTIRGTPIPGAMDAMLNLINRGYKVVILSARPREQIVPWLTEHWPFKMYPAPEVTNTKIPAIAYVDDRAVRFENNWPQILELFPFKS